MLKYVPNKRHYRRIVKTHDDDDDDDDTSISKRTCCEWFQRYKRDNVEVVYRECTLCITNISNYYT